MKNIILSLGILGAFTHPVLAEDYSIPKKDSIFSISFPEKWSITHSDESINAVTEDATIQLYAQTDDAETLDASIEGAIEYLVEAGVKIDDDSKKDNEGEVNGITINGVNWDATDKDGPCRVSLSFMDVGADEVITLLYWGSSEAEKKHSKDLESILGSMKPLKGAEGADAEEVEEEEAEAE